MQAINFRDNFKNSGHENDESKSRSILPEVQGHQIKNINLLELRQHKNNTDQFERIPRLKLPRFFNHRMSHAWANQHVFFGI